MILIVDANVIVGDPRLKSPRWIQLAGPGPGGIRTVRLTIPRIAVLESIARHRESRSQVLGEMKALRRKTGFSALHHLDALVQTTQEEIDTYEALLLGRLDELGFDILPTPRIDLDALAQKAIDREPPFDTKGNGFRDALIWEIVLDLLGNAPDDEVVLLSNDRAAFAEKSGELRSELVDEAEGYLQTGSMTLATSLDAVIIPGRYRGEPLIFQLDEELGAALRDHLAGFSAEGSLVPESFGFHGIDYLEIRRMEALDLLELSVHRLNEEVALEILFTARVNAELDLSYVGIGSDGEPRDMMATEWRQLRLTGRARSDIDQLDIRSIDSMSMSLNTSPYIPPTREAGGIWEVVPERYAGIDLDKQVSLWDSEEQATQEDPA